MLFITIDSNDFPETHQVGLTRVERMLFLREEMSLVTDCNQMPDTLSLNKHKLPKI